MELLICLLQTINILWFGHSYGQDCTEYLPELAVRVGVQNLKVGRFVKSNCSLEEHYNYYLEDITSVASDNGTPRVYYSECAYGKTRFTDAEKTVREVVQETQWDYVVFQNSLENEGRYHTAQPYLNNLVSYVTQTQKDKFGKSPQIVWNMFWPISHLMEDGSHKLCTERLSYYDNSSAKMWAAYIDATKELVEDTGIQIVIPSGTAVVNARATSVNSPDAYDLTRDGYHMSNGVGRYLAACAVYQKLIAPLNGKSVLGNPWRVTKKALPVMDDKTAKILQRCAVAAVEQPYQTSEITEK